jgi:ABC-type amino acid transport substrate-binding protein
MKANIFRIGSVTALIAITSLSYAQTPPVKPNAEPTKPAHAAKASASDKTRQLDTTNKRRVGDFDQMLERRVIRVDAPYSRSLYFVDKGRERGIGAELVRDFERWVNQKYAKQLGKRPITVYIVAATRDKLLPDLRDGLADISIGNLTVTEARQKLVDFIAPDDIRKVNEIVVTGPASPAIASLDDLAGKRVHVRKVSRLLRQPVGRQRTLQEGREARSDAGARPRCA